MARFGACELTEVEIKHKGKKETGERNDWQSKSTYIRETVTNDCGQSVFLLGGDDTTVLCMDTDIQNFRDFPY